MFAVESLVGSVSEYLIDTINKFRRERMEEGQSGGFLSVQQESDGPPDNEGS
jgi:hypothetical protein